MQTYQTRQILAIIKTKFSRENAIFNVTLQKQTGSSVRWFFLVCLFLCRVNYKLIVSEASPEI